MDEADLGSMQGQPGSSAFIGDRFSGKWPAIDFIAAQRMPGFRKMNADLMRASRFQPAFDDGVALESLDWFDVSHRPFSEFRVFRAAAAPVAPIVDQVGFERLLVHSA